MTWVEMTDGNGITAKSGDYTYQITFTRNGGPSIASAYEGENMHIKADYIGSTEECKAWCDGYDTARPANAVQWKPSVVITDRDIERMARAKDSSGGKG